MKKSVRKIMFNRRKLKREREKKTRAVVKKRRKRRYCTDCSAEVLKHTQQTKKGGVS